MPMDVPTPLGFRFLLDQAVSDLSSRGYVSREQLEEWLRILRLAAEREVGSDERVDQITRDALGSIFERLIERGKVVDYAPGVGRYTIAMIKPKLRAELDRRILAATDLIKLHRREAVERTLQRFSGWSTAIPPGGDETVDKRAVKSSIGKSLKQFQFEQRRVDIDQGHKLISNVSNIVAMDNGAIAAEWHSHWRQAGYNYRVDHKERDQKIYAIRDSWAHQEGLINKGAGFTDEMTAPAQEPFCRCYMRYIMSPRRLPDSMLTRKGQEWIARSSMGAMAA